MATSLPLLQTALKHHQAGEIEQAEAFYREILRAASQHADALHLLGVAVYQQGRNEQAVEWISRAVELNGSSATYYSNLGAAFRAMGRLDDAVSSYRHALEIAPENAGIHYNLGNALKDLQQFAEALDCYEQEIRLNPNFAEAYNNMGDALKQLGEIEKAIDAHTHALKINPSLVEAHFNLGNAFRACDRLEEATCRYEQGLKLRPDYLDAAVNLGYTLEDLGRIAEAIIYYEQALKINPECAAAHFNRALAWLRQTDFKQGWEEYEWRWKNKNETPPNFGLPAWQGELLTGKTLLITAEQGIGDEIMFASCFEDLLKQSAGAVIECESRLVPLFARSFPAATIVHKPVSRSLECERSTSRPDVQIALAGLPRFFRPNLESFPNHHGYLKSNPERITFWRKRFDRLGRGLKVGISWRGGNDPNVRRRCSTTLDQWKPVLSVPNMHFINLQYGESITERTIAREQCAVEIFDWEDSDPLKDLDDFAAEIAALDLVISVDNSTVHIAGALGVPVWTLLPFASDWRWFLDQHKSPWYPSMRLFRQSQFGDWTDVFHCVAKELYKQNQGASRASGTRT
jgi:tetratricopeptide (TPR) repeat protein